ncbi:hypothetical protein [Kitasatospora sp. NBC_00315]|uniref:hypothetical protein n=1 Tax=Kitasatospora sp. NBC_00315 TaxID=2975963 RepID=UPI0032521A2D
MPVFPEEPDIHESIPGPGVPFPRESDAQALRTPAASSAFPVLNPTHSLGVATSVAATPGPRPGPPRPAPPRAARPGPPPPPVRATEPGPAARRPAPAARRPAPAVRHVGATAGDALERADEMVDELLESGRKPGDILVLTVGEPHPWHTHELSFGEERYWAQLSEGADVFYADAAPARPVRREVVVLVVNDASADRAAQAFRTALGHADDLVVVCGGARPAGVTGAAEGRPAPV